MYDYRKELKNDLVEYALENNLLEEVAEHRLADELYYIAMSSDITGNDSGSYFCSSHKAKEALANNIDLLISTCVKYGAYAGRDLDAETVDVLIRIDLLDEVVPEVVEELLKNRTETN